MKKCQNCSTPFGLGKILKSTWLGYYNLGCDRCGVEFQHSLLNRALVGLVITVSLISAYYIGEHFELGYGGSVVIALLLNMLLAVITTPFLKFTQVE